MTWVLVLVAFGWGYNAGAAITYVPGFKTGASCELAARQLTLVKPGTGIVVARCVRAG